MQRHDIVTDWMNTRKWWRDFQEHPVKTLGVGPVLFLGALVIYWIIYAPTFDLTPRGDDWPWLAPIRGYLCDFGFFEAVAKSATYVMHGLWRPLTVIPFLISPESIPTIQCTKALVFLVLPLLTMLVAKEMGLSKTTSWVLGAAHLLHQTVVLPVSEVDFWGDILCAVGVLGQFYIGLRHHSKRLRPLLYIVLTSVFGGLAVFSKEAGIAFLFIPMALTFWGVLQRRHVRRGHLYATITALLVVGSYFVLRHAVGGLTASSPEVPLYQFHLGANLPLNVLLVAAGLLSPVNTVEAVVGPIGWRILALGFVLILAAICLLGLRVLVRRKDGLVPLTALLLCVAVQGPVLLLPHVSEWNVLRSLGLGLVGVGVCWEALLLVSRRNVRMILVGLLVLSLAFHVHADVAKVRDIVTLHNESAQFYKELRELYPAPPAKRMVVAAIEPNDRFRRPRPLLHMLMDRPRQRADQHYSLFRESFASSLSSELPWSLRDLYRDSALEVTFHSLASVSELRSISPPVHVVVLPDRTPIPGDVAMRIVSQQ